MVFEKLKDIFARVMPQCDPSTITMDSVLTTDLGVDSLNMMLLAITVEDEFKSDSVLMQNLKLLKILLIMQKLTLNRGTYE